MLACCLSNVVLLYPEEEEKKARVRCIARSICRTKGQDEDATVGRVELSWKCMHRLPVPWRSTAPASV